MVIRPIINRNIIHKCKKPLICHPKTSLYNITYLLFIITIYIK